MFDVKITGLTELQRDLEDAQRAIASLGGTIAEVKVNPDDPASVEKALREMEAAIDRIVAPHGNNKLVATVVKAAKEEYRKRILKLADSKK